MSTYQDSQAYQAIDPATRNDHQYVTPVAGHQAKSLSGAQIAVAVLTEVSIIASCIIGVITFEYSDDSKKNGLNFGPYTKDFNHHPVLMLVGYVFFMNQAILAWRILPASHGVVKAIHGICHLFALVFVITGLYYIFYFHKKAQIDDIYSLHSWFGLIAVILFSLQLFGGAVAFFLPVFPTHKRQAAMPWHQFFGALSLFLVTAAVITGVMDRQRLLNDFGYNTSYYLTPNTRQYNAVGLLAALGAVGVATTISPFWQHLGRVGSASEQQSLL